jgi:DNA-binding IclR family transcriptional regulator
MVDAVRNLSDLDVETADLAALRAAVDQARAKKRGVSHEEMRKWLLEIAAGNFDAEPPAARDL